ncbi:peptidoglycan recognition protein family protein [Ruminiclostridium cellobioparum]|uniref:peptidoglycan recognition protein family protein n=1 Tax=Ruminiclostridium cellobioparum TaxID=29355 RepID=UPI0028B007DC|nr:peptidoglycan recognition family protein [Ruminiclostridium cellobioparum]
MKQEGKFILMNRDEFRIYIEGLKGAKTFKTIQQHHTASPAYKDVKNNHIQLMKGMENYHVNTLKMSEIAQHFSTFPDGSICVGRPLTKDGGGFLSPLNKDSITIENVGNFDSDIMTEEQKQSIILLNALLCKKFNIVPSTSALIYHCWVQKTSCPGLKWFVGNTRTDAEKNFIPLIKAAMEEPLTFEQALEIVSKKVDTVYQYWLKRKDIDPAFSALIIKIAKSFGGE